MIYVIVVLLVFVWSILDCQSSNLVFLLDSTGACIRTEWYSTYLCFGILDICTQYVVLVFYSIVFWNFGAKLHQ